MTTVVTAAGTVAVATTERPSRPARRGGSDRVTVMLFSLAAFLAVLAVLISQLAITTVAQRRAAVIIRRVYRTTVIETVVGGHTGRTTVSRSTSSSGGPPATPAPAPTTRAS